MDLVKPGVWLGNSYDAGDAAKLKEERVSAILNVAFDLRPALSYPDFTVVHCGLIDGPGNRVEAYMSAILQLFVLRRADHNVLVHCHEGKSRSPNIVVGWQLFTKHAKTYEEAMGEIAKVRPQIDPRPAHRDMIEQAVMRLHYGYLGGH